MKKLSLILAMFVLSLLCINSVYAGGGDIMTIEGIQDIYYPGDTINLNIKFIDEYYTMFGDDRKVTDFEISLNGVQAVLDIEPVLEGASWSSKNMSVYYLQLLETSQKLKFVGGETVAKYTEEVADMDYLTELDDEGYYRFLEMDRTGYVSLSGKYYFDDGSKMELQNDRINICIVPYIEGDFDLNKDVDFFDITSLITAVYETEAEAIGWRNREAVTTNTKAYTTDETYNHRTAELGFTDIIYLIKTVYD